MLALRTASRTADWLEVAVGRLEAWKGSSARARARRALEFVKVWYPGLDLDPLAAFRSEAQAELATVEGTLVERAAAIADYTNTLDPIWPETLSWVMPGRGRSTRRSPT